MSIFGSTTYLGGYYGPIATLNSNPVAPGEKVVVEGQIEREQILTAVNVGGFDTAPPPSPLVYWKMRTYPTCAFSYSLIIVPILAGTRTLVIRNADGTDALPEAGISTGVGVQVTQSPEQKRKKRAEDDFETHWTDILTGSGESLNFGNFTQEVIWDRRDGLTVPVKFRSFLPWEIDLQRSPYNEFAGFKHGQIERDRRYAFHCVWQKQFDPIYGVPRAENARQAWFRAVKTQENLDKIERKASGIQMMLEIPTGSSFVDSNGKRVITQEMAQTITNAAASGNTITIPIPWTKEDIRSNAKLAEIPLIRVQQFDWGKVGTEITASIASLARKDVEIVRGYLRPEREAMQGQHGTQAEAGVQGQIGVKDSELVGGEFYGQFNKQTFNDYLATNYGPRAMDSMYWKMGPLADPQQQFKQTIAETMMASLTAGPQLTAEVDGRTLLKELELPLRAPGSVPAMPSLTDGMSSTPEESIQQQMDGAAFSPKKKDALKLSADNKDGDGDGFVTGPDGKDDVPLDGDAGDSTGSASSREGYFDDEATDWYAERKVPDGWYVHGRQPGRGQDDLETGFVTLGTEDLDVADQYSSLDPDGVWYLQPTDDAKVMDMTGRDADRVVDALLEDQESGTAPSFVDDEVDRYGLERARSRLKEAVNPKDIVDSAGAWDDTEFVHWHWEKFEAHWIKTEDGIACLDKSDEFTRKKRVSAAHIPEFAS